MSRALLLTHSAVNTQCLLRKRDADIAITLSRCVCVWGGGWGCSLARQNENPWSEWLKTWHNSSPRQSVRAYCFWIQKGKSQGHHSELLAPPSYLWNGCSYNVQISCTNALRAVSACWSNKKFNRYWQTRETRLEVSQGHQTWYHLHVRYGFLLVFYSNLSLEILDISIPWPWNAGYR